MPTGRPVRLVFDLDRHRIALEETTGKMLREKEEGESTGAGAEAATEQEKEAREYADGIVEGPKAPRASFTPVEKFGGDDDDEGKGGRSLGDGVKYRLVQTEHDGEPRTKGRAYLYIWPGGTTERAVIQLYRDADSDGLTVMVSALTGRAKIKRGRVELEERRTDEDFGVREEE